MPSRMQLLFVYFAENFAMYSQCFVVLCLFVFTHFWPRTRPAPNFPEHVQNAGKTFAPVFESDKYLCSLTVALFVSEHKPHSKIKRFYSWFCGYEAGTEEAKKAAHEQHERLQQLTSLERNRYAETFLNINVLIIMAIGLYLYIFFSI